MGVERRRVVVKIGSSSLVDVNGGLDLLRLDAFVDQVAEACRRGYQVLVVTSGAIATGRPALRLPAGPIDLPDKQAAAAVGQMRLMQHYGESFARHGLTPAQILLTRQDIASGRKRHNIRATIEALLAQNAIPVINENDTVGTEEIHFGDNDFLSALVAELAEASLLVLLTDTDGLYSADPRLDPQAQLIGEVAGVTQQLVTLGGASISGVGTGGMRSKILAASRAAKAGIAACITNSARPRALLESLEGKQVGTRFLPEGGTKSPCTTHSTHSTHATQATRAVHAT